MDALSDSAENRTAAITGSIARSAEVDPSSEGQLDSVDGRL